MIKKLFSGSLIFVIVLTLLSASTNVAFARNNPSWHWEEYQISQFVSSYMAVDDRCDDANIPFKVTVFENSDYSGSRARICGRWDDLTQLPQQRIANSPTFHNTISSIWVKELGVDSVEFHDLKDQEGQANGFQSTGKFVLSGESNNSFSSVRPRTY